MFVDVTYKLRHRKPGAQAGSLYLPARPGTIEVTEKGYISGGSFMAGNPLPEGLFETVHC